MKSTLSRPNCVRVWVGVLASSTPVSGDPAVATETLERAVPETVKPESGEPEAGPKAPKPEQQVLAELKVPSEDQAAVVATAPVAAQAAAVPTESVEDKAVVEKKPEEELPPMKPMAEARGYWDSDDVPFMARYLQLPRAVGTWQAALTAHAISSDLVWFADTALSFKDNATATKHSLSTLQKPDDSIIAIAAQWQAKLEFAWNRTMRDQIEAYLYRMDRELQTKIVASRTQAAMNIIRDIAGMVSLIQHVAANDLKQDEQDVPQDVPQDSVPQDSVPQDSTP
ncbi:hypothetical protein GNI_036300 [Gregarina niphandrodes]|uniref:Uncharacterized protein n=1 Tax=Gregarina niphandrodes TaxID=110365 RepID=A0A023BAN7_GRENI|nr:hypothetical protein GNI_036300 [Gregarina niphandrodes]EZG78429.1 hypothetical protein GNI_036300 [Gregarina niphandrodes]|eukprot:XP_011129303.1 hypothetical protein GNI_036300 [Gregarina niphandrodes]